MRPAKKLVAFRGFHRRMERLMVSVLRKVVVRVIRVANFFSRFFDGTREHTGTGG